MTSRGRSLPRCTLVAAMLCLLMLPLEVAAAEAELRPENELILEVELDGDSLGTDVLGYQRGTEFMVSLSELMQVLEFPISVDASEGRAEGWFISDERTFMLDLSAGEVVSDGRTYPVERSDVARFEGDLFVSAQRLSEWFPLQVRPRVGELVFEVVPTETIPLQQRRARRTGMVERRERSRREPELPLQQTPYRLAGPHATDLRLDYSNVRSDSDSSVRHDARYSLLSRGELGWMTSTLSVSGRDGDEVEEGRLRLERANLDAPANLNHVELGDISIASARGAMVRGGPGGANFGGRFSDEATDIRGDVLPDWEVELYQNGLFIDAQVVGSDGQYEFLDVPLEFGDNRFELVFYGPFGEERREEITRFVGQDAVGFGSVSYELAAVQAGRSVFDVGTRGGRGERNTGRYLANFNLGLSQRVAAQFGVDSFESGGERTEYFDAGLSAAWDRMQANLSYNYRPDDQDRINSLLRTRLNDTRLSVGHSVFSTQGLEPGDIPDNRRLWRSNFRLTSRPYNVPLDASGNHTRRDDTTTTRVAMGSTVRFGRQSRLSKNFRYLRQDDRAREGMLENQLTGNLNVSTNLRPWRLRAGVGYQAHPEVELSSLRSSASLRVDRQMTMDFEARRNVLSGRTRYLAGFSWLLDSLRLSPRVTYDTNERWAGLISLSTSINPRPGRWKPEFERLSHANTGSVRARAFIDHEGDGEFGEGDEPLEGVRFDAVQSFRHARTGQDGQAYLNRLPNYRQTDVAVDPETIPDYDLRPSQAGVSVKPRPGSWSTVDVPMIRTMELEGRVHGETREGAVEPRARVLLSLVDEEGEVVARQRSAFDGFFLFTGVEPGRYELRLDDEELNARLQEHPGEVNVGSDGGVKHALDFLIGPPPKRTLFDPPMVEEDQGFIPDEAPAGLPEQDPEAESEPESETHVLDSQGSWAVQLGVFSSHDNAWAAWDRVRAEQSGLLAGFGPRLPDLGDLIGLHLSPRLSEQSARGLCDRLDAAGVDCLVREQ